MSIFEKKYLPLIISIVTIVLNIIMFIQTQLTENSNDSFSNLIAIVVVAFLYAVNRIALKSGKERQVRIEYYGILALFAVSLIRIANRFCSIPFEVNVISAVVIIGFATFALAIAIGRILRFLK